ncbi:hypothetical protein ASD78_08970 [Lysobacter sp. Root667]|uniref:M48 family metallopeptidase n=1 Tax=Lysobacter sp. Root667 TaxID=1736581 RepID=UPI0006F2BED2|nr:M48 family metallopeptidase [Lysobacter sp. Root667]KRA75130.1 hypothetical protein ASD78_08970 [Lysobacter sp. Root667]
MASVARYRGLVERLEQEAQRAPGRYKFKLALLAGLGFAVLGGTVLLALGMSAGLVLALLAISPILLVKLIKVVWIPVAFGWFVIKAIWVKFEPPTGHVLAPDEAPELRAEIERLRAQTQAPPLHDIIIDPQLNAGAASVPRALGLLGHTHYLVIGLPLMQLLSREQFAAVIAHEFGHFGGGHGRFSGWIYRVRVSWYRFLEELAMRRSWTTALFRRFFDWYAPYFDAYSFVLARAQEYDADATAARVTGAPAMAQALQRVGLGSARLQRDFWPDVERSVQTRPQPPQQLFRDMAGSFAAASHDEPVRLQELLDEAPGLDDTHPTLAQRLQALGQAPVAVPAPVRSAAEDLLGPLLDSLQERFSQEWREHVAENWRERHDRHTQDVERLAELETRADALADTELGEYARLVEVLRPDADAAPLYRAAVAARPDDALAQARLGALLLDRQDAEGVAYLERAIELDENLLEQALQLLAQFYRQADDEAGFGATISRLRALHQRRDVAMQARERVDAKKDRYLEHGLDAEALRVAADGLQRAGHVKQAWIARKHIDGDDTGVPHYVVVVTLRGMAWTEDGMLQKVVDALELPGSFVAVHASSQRKLAKRIKAVAGAPVYGPA